MSRDLKIRMIFAAAQTATKPIREIALGSKALSRDLKSSTDELQRLNRTQSQMTAFRGLKLQSRETGQALEFAKAKVTNLGQAIANSDKPTRKMTSEFARAKKEAALLQKQLVDERQELQRLRGSLGEAGINTTKFGQHQTDLRRDIERTTAEIEQQGTKLKAVGDRHERLSRAKGRIGSAQERGSDMAITGAAAMGAGYAIGARLNDSTQEAMTFESKMIDVKKVLNDVDDKQIKTIEIGIMKLAERIPITQEGLAQIAAEGARAGIAAKDLIGFTEGAAKMAAAFDMEASAAGAMQAQWQTGLGLTIPQITLLGDKVNALTNKFGGAAINVTDMITRVGPLGKVAGVASGEMAAMAQLMDKVGVQSEVGATGIKRMMLTLNVGASATKSQSAAFERLGLDAVEMSKRMQTDAKGGILSVLDAINRLPKEEQAGLLTKLFGSESVAAIAPMLSSLDQLKKNFDLVADASAYTGSMNTEFGVAMSKTENKMKLGSNAFTRMKIAFGTQLLPVLDQGRVIIGGIANSLAGWLEQHPGLTKAIGITVAVATGLLLLVGGLAIGIGAILGPFAMLRYALVMAGPALGGVAGAFGFLKTALMATGRAFLMNPIGLAITAIALGAYLIYRNWDKIGPFFTRMWANVKAIFWGTWEGIKALFFNYHPAGLIYNHWNSISGFFAGLWANVKAGVLVGWNALKAAFFAYHPAGLIYVHWNSISGFFAGLWANVKAGVMVGWNALKATFFNYHPAGLIYTHWNSVSGYFAGLWNKVKGIFSGAWTAIRANMAGWATSAISIGHDIVSGLASGIRAAPGAVWNALKQVVGFGIDNVKRYLGIKSPSRLFIGIGRHVIDGLSIGLTRDSDAPVNAMSRLAQRVGKAGSAIVTSGTALSLAASPASAHGATGGSSAAATTNHYEINIYTRGGASAEEIAAEVEKILARKDRDQEARKRSTFRDDEE